MWAAMDEYDAAADGLRIPGYYVFLQGTFLLNMCFDICISNSESISTGQR